MPNKIDEIFLPEGLVWTDEFKTTQIAQSTTRTLSGALVIQTGVKIDGRPMTLAGGDSGWMTHSQLVTLRNYLEANPDTEMTLNYRGIEYTVLLDASSGAALVAEPVVDYSTPEADDWYTVTLKLLTTAGA